MPEEDKETSSEQVEPLEVKPIKGIKGTVMVFANKEIDQEWKRSIHIKISQTHLKKLSTINLKL